MARSTSYLRVRFTEPREFVDELRTDAALVERGVVRLSGIYRPRGDGVTAQLSVIAAAIVEGRPVHLEHPIGDVWGNQADASTVSTAELLMDDLRSELEALGLTIRPGLLEENDA